MKVGSSCQLPPGRSYQLIAARPREPAHLHLDVGFARDAGGEEAPNSAADEVHRAGWFSLADVAELDTFRLGLSDQPNRRLNAAPTLLPAKNCRVRCTIAVRSSSPKASRRLPSISASMASI